MLYYLVLVLPRVFAAGESFGERLRIETHSNSSWLTVACARTSNMALDSWRIGF